MISMVITIDGPAGAGKTTISRKLADLLGYRYVDTGALYRGVAWAATEAAVDFGDEEALSLLLGRLRLDLVRDGEGGLRLLADGRDISAEIRTPAMSMAASAVARLPKVRAFLLDVQKRLGAEKKVVFEGRDMGTVVFPEADVKFFLTADLLVRARRRHAEMPPDAGHDLEHVLEDMRRRDAQDAGRDLAPLAAAHDAVHIDASGLSVDDVLAVMMRRIRQTGGESPA